MPGTQKTTRHHAKRSYARRYPRILLFFSRVLFSLIVWELLFPRIGFSGWSRNTRSQRLRKSAAQFRQLAISMGGVLIKVGQFFSSRVDVLPEEVTSELSGLQDEVTPEDFEDIRWLAEVEFGLPLEEKYAEFSSQPWAAASLGQVHLARLKGEGSRQVVVKIQRPDIEEIITVDLRALRTVGGWLNYYPPIRRRIDVRALMNEFTRILYEEIDYLAEGRNAETFAANFEDNPRILVPEVIWTHTTRRVLTLEDVRGIKITDYQAITNAGIDRRGVAQLLLDTYLKQIFEDGFFHGDPHPGNLFVRPVSDVIETDRGEGEWLLTFVDFGMVGRVPPNLQAGMREMLIGIALRDAPRLIKAYQMMGILLPGADLKLLEQAEEEAFRRFWGKSMNELKQVSFQEMHEFMLQFRKLIYTMPIQVPQDLILLVRVVGILSGMCTGLDEDFNVFEGIVPYVQKMVAAEAPQGWERWKEMAGILGRKLLDYPRRIDSLLAMVERGELSVRVPELMELLSRLERNIYRLIAALLFVGFFLAGIQLYSREREVLAILSIVAAGLSFMWMVLGGWRRNR